MDVSHMKPVTKKIKRKLQSKSKAVAWFVTHCSTPSKRGEYVQNLTVELNKYELKVDIYGYCGNLECIKDDETCHIMLETDYYFYLDCENSLCEDYVTEKVLTATKHFTVPIVYGGADYNRLVIKISINYTFF